MKRILFLLPIMMLGLTSCGDKLTAESVEASILQGEKAELPLLIQSMALIVDDITIDSVRVTVDEEPMQGYIYTTWKKGKNEQSIIVLVDSIRQDANRKGYIQWLTLWEDAATSYVMKSIKF
jgi:hypothetical protein